MTNQEYIYSLEDISVICSELKKKNKIIIFTNGCFDILHPGHTTYLRDAKALGDFLIVGINGDSSVKKLKGKKRPINNLNYRASMLASLKPVDAVVTFDEDTPYSLIETLMPDILVKGGDYSTNEVVGGELIKNNGGDVKILTFVKGFSSTEILKKIKENA